MRSNLVLVSILTAGLALAVRAEPAEACGPPFKVNPGGARTAKRSSNPSRVLLVGRHSRNLETKLLRAGHKVEIVPTAQTADNTDYAVVIVESEAQLENTRKRFARSAVLVRTDSAAEDFRTVEGRVTRGPIATHSRNPVKVQPRPVPIRWGGSTQTPPVNTMAPTAPPVASGTDTVVPPPVQIQTPPRASTIETSPPTNANLREELFFGRGSSKVDNARVLTKTAKWLTSNPSVTVTIEGYADPTGAADDNLKLSQSRADSVKDWLVAHGVDASRIEVEAFGETKLKYGESDARNRRVSIEAKH